MNSAIGSKVQKIALVLMCDGGGRHRLQQNV
jgi:hypothetical protein